MSRRFLRVFGAPGLAALLLIGCARTPAPVDHPNVLLITVDTLRADRLGCYGGPVATPHVDRLAAEGTLFEQALCPMPMTRPSHFSIFTGKYPREHGVIHNATALPPDWTTLTDVLAGAGYDTAGFVSVWLLDPDSGAARSFAHFDSPGMGNRFTAEAITPRVVDWLARRPRERPFFAWLHLFDPHMPYDPPARFAPPASPEMMAKLPMVDWGRVDRLAFENGGDFAAPLLERARALYDGEVRVIDAAIGEVIAALERDGSLDRTVVVLTADHGECFEHGVYFEHATCLFDGAVRVPLIVRFPAAVPADARRSGVVEHVSIASTVLTLAQVAVPAQFAARSLFADDPPAAEFAVVERPRPMEAVVARRTRKSDGLKSVAGDPVRLRWSRDVAFALRDGRWTFLSTPSGEELYDRGAGAEGANVAAAHAEVVARARAALRTWLQQHPERSGTDDLPLSSEFKERLRVLGYQ